MEEIKIEKDVYDFLYYTCFYLNQMIGENMSSLCNANCNDCNFKENCCGCTKTNGSPFGGRCIAAEYIKVGGIQKY